MFTLLKTIAVECYRRNRVLTVVGGSALACVLPMLLAAAIDTRTVMGLNPWIKPMKFSASLGIYFLTLGWLMAYLPRPRRAVRAISWITAAALLFESPILVLQAARGLSSHFNVATPLDALLYYIMGAAAFTQVALLAWALALFCTEQVDLPRLYLYGIRAGMAWLLIGILPGVAMVVIGAHAVGVADGGAGLPLLNWSTTGGDLRIAHFFGLHAIQALPLAGLLLARLERVVGRRTSLALFALFSTVYVLVLIGTFVQALAGHPLVAQR